MRPGERVNGFLIERLVGEGGMSWVYLAQDPNGDPVAVKRLKDEFAIDSNFVTRFEQEARIMGQLQHPHLARVLAYIPRRGEFLLVEEFLSGGSLADRMAAGPIPEKQALVWIRDALTGVDCAHREGILHRDLKPGNLMFDSHGNMKITDFGIAKVFGSPKLTRTRSEMGTPAYMSPEQIRSPDKAYHLTDVYSMGVVLYELLTSRVPFERDGDFDTKQAVVRDPPPPPRRFNPLITKELEDIVLKAIEKDPNRRYGGCGEFAGTIDGYLRHRSPGFDVREWTRKHPKLAAAVIAFIVLIALALLSVSFAAVRADGYHIQAARFQYARSSVLIPRFTTGERR